MAVHIEEVIIRAVVDQGVRPRPDDVCVDIAVCSSGEINHSVSIFGAVINDKNDKLFIAIHEALKVWYKDIYDMS